MSDKDGRLIKVVTCLGFADAHEDDPLFGEAFGVGKALAEAGYTVANGGGPGVMRATTLGAKSAGGHDPGSAIPRGIPVHTI